MAIEQIPLGQAPDGEDGADARTAFETVNQNFAELDSRTTAVESAAALAGEQAEEASAAAGAAVAAVDGKVDKVDGKGLSSNDFTSGEKAKLAGLESSHFKGAFASLAALQAARPTGSAGDYADVDTGLGQDVARYVWDVSDAKWVKSGAGDALASAQVKVLYEANPDTNAFTDAQKAQLAGIAAGATANANTDTLAEGSTNQYFTAARVRAVVLTGLATATNVVIAATDTVLGALAKLQGQINALKTGKLDATATAADSSALGGQAAAAYQLKSGLGTAATKNITISSAAPSGGVDGDLWFQV